jgi:hypothetical protein
MPPAVIAAGAVAAGTIGGAVISSSASKKAAKQANAAQQQATDSQLQLGRENINFQQGIYNQNRALLSPFVDRGNVAGQSINALLGLPAAQATPQPAQSYAQPYSPGQPTNSMWDAYLSANPDVAAESKRVTADGEFASPEDYAAWHYQHYGQNEGRQIPQPQTAPVAAQEPVATQQPIDATGAFNNFANSAGMQFQLQQGENAINNGYAAKGQLQSGAALKGLQNYGQQTALNNYFLPYLGLLGGQQATGAQAGSAIAGVGSNFGNTVSNIYGQQSNAIQSGANAASNAALLKGQANANLWSGVGGALGGLASSFVPSTGSSKGWF